METTRGSLLSELQTIWDEIGEPDNERDKMLYELEQGCLDAYRIKVDQARHCQVQLRQSLADCEAQLADICDALGDGPVRKKKISGTLKKELQAIMPQLEDMKKKPLGFLVFHYEAETIRSMLLVLKHRGEFGELQKGNSK